jgi:hypothetical protein
MPVLLVRGAGEASYIWAHLDPWVYSGRLEAAVILSMGG